MLQFLFVAKISLAHQIYNLNYLCKLRIIYFSLNSTKKHDIMRVTGEDPGFGQGGVHERTKLGALPPRKKINGAEIST